MPKVPQITVIVPVYNAEDNLYQSLDSVYWQTFPDIEIICVIDGSTDGSMRIAEEFVAKDNRFQIVDKYSGGSSSAKNAGLEEARGKYILFLEPNDWIAHRLCERTLIKAEEEEAEMLFFNMLPFNQKGMLSDSLFNYPQVKGSFQPMKQPQFLVQANTGNRLFRRDFIGDARFDEGIIMEDKAFLAEMDIRAKRAVLLDEPLYYCRKDNSSSAEEYLRTDNEIFFQSIDAVTQVLEKYGAYETLYYSVFAADEIEHYMERIKVLPHRHYHEFFSMARQRAQKFDWKKVMESFRQPYRRFRPDNSADTYFLTCLQRGGFWRYSSQSMAGDWRKWRFLLFSLPVVGGFLEWCFVVTRINSI